jgi:hypothetical protein
MLVVVLLVLGLALAPSTALAQNDEPYGPTTTTTTTPPDDAPHCMTLQVDGRVGDTATVRVDHVPHGTTVRILIGGEEAGRATAPSGFQSGTVTMNIEVVVPNLPPGTYEVVAVGAGFTISCRVGDGNLFDVLAAADRRDSGFDVLAFTGLNILLLIAIALALLLIGRQLLRRSKRLQGSSRGRRAPA